VKEKTLAASRAGILEVVLPVGNERDLRDVPDDVREAMRFHTVDHMDQVFELALMEKPSAPAQRRRSSGSARREQTRRKVAARATDEREDEEEAPRKEKSRTGRAAAPKNRKT
jgi:ATP-dependent Lon protease